MGMFLHHNLVISQLLRERDTHLLIVRLQMWLFHHLVNVLELAFYDIHSMKTSRCYLLIERGKSVPRQIIPSWNVFYITIHEGLPVMKSPIKSLDCNDSPATHMSTIYQVGLSISMTVVAVFI